MTDGNLTPAMPRTTRAKRAKVESATAASPSPPRHPPSERSSDHPSINANKDKDADGKAIEERNPPTPDSDETFDPALLDEEEMPAVPPDASPSAREKRGVGAYARRGGYNDLKSFEGKYYSGMAVGGSHTWNYDPGVWKETKMEPDLWRVEYNTTKRRARNAPRGSGAPVGTEYHWLIVAHQHVKKMDANTYETRLAGSKYKLAHKAAASGSWSIPTVKGQREREIELLDDSKRRVQGLPPVLAAEKVKVEKVDKGQQKLDTLFAKAGEKRKRVQEAGQKGDQAIMADPSDGGTAEV
ncbi:hypothetical protein FQN54_009987 [Arachnomyces sp. PD_36]|nr:hypothetical protein FQN54_009987 [Arachnomyces sp. PD_36]